MFCAETVCTCNLMGYDACGKVQEACVPSTTAHPFLNNTARDHFPNLSELFEGLRPVNSVLDSDGKIVRAVLVKSTPECDEEADIVAMAVTVEEQSAWDTVVDEHPERYELEAVEAALGCAWVRADEARCQAFFASCSDDCRLFSPPRPSPPPRFREAPAVSDVDSHTAVALAAQQAQRQASDSAVCSPAVFSPSSVSLATCSTPSRVAPCATAQSRSGDMLAQLGRSPFSTPGSYCCASSQREGDHDDKAVLCSFEMLLSLGDDVNEVSCDCDSVDEEEDEGLKCVGGLPMAALFQQWHGYD